jgi:hypothetical protein
MWGSRTCSTIDCPASVLPPLPQLAGAIVPAGYLIPALLPQPRPASLPALSPPRRGRAGAVGKQAPPPGVCARATLPTPGRRHPVTEATEATSSVRQPVRLGVTQSAPQPPGSPHPWFVVCAPCPAPKPKTPIESAAARGTADVAPPGADTAPPGVVSGEVQPSVPPPGPLFSTQLSRDALLRSARPSRDNACASPGTRMRPVASPTTKRLPCGGPRQ